MYVNQVEINNVKGIQKFELTFHEGEQAGWHVLIGDNGSGKTTILRCIAMCLFGAEMAPSLKLDWDNWLSNKKESGSIQVMISNKSDENKSQSNEPIPSLWKFIRESNYVRVNVNNEAAKKFDTQLNELWFGKTGWFSAGFGPFRRFSGGMEEWKDIYNKSIYCRIAAHLTLFNESASLSETIEWLKLLKFRQFEGKSVLIDEIFNFINSPDFLPGNVKLNDVNSDEVTFMNGNNELIPINQLSDGFRSILAMTFELVRLLSAFYPNKKLFYKHKQNYYYVKFPGVVLIDEIDIHLHPSWQNEIGQWFIKYFPNIQFIVTTHSPIICRACEHSTIWKLPVPGTDEEAREITGTEKNKLVYGSILDQYGTGDFGKDVTITKKASESLKEFARLRKLKLFGRISKSQNNHLSELEKIFIYDATNEAR